MITIKIGSHERSDDNINARWITDQLNARKREDVKIGVFFKVNCGDLNLSLLSRDCPRRGGGGGRQPNAKEEFILDEWKKKGFLDLDINPGMVVSFWTFVKRLCD